MTIVAGFSSPDGWVIASDSQETVSDYSKNSIDKIRHLNISPQWRLIFAAAGHAAYADMLQGNIEKECKQTAPTLSFDAVEKIIAEQVTALHREHIWPRQPQDRPSVETLILVQQLTSELSSVAQMKMFSTSDTAVFPVDLYRAIGIGAHMADYLYDMCFHPIMETEEVERSAVYMLKKIKESVVGCDGETVVCTFLDGGVFRYIRTKDVKHIEAAFASYDWAARSLFRGIARPSYPNADFRKDLKKGEHAIIEARESMQGLEIGRRRELESMMDSLRKLK